MDVMPINLTAVIAVFMGISAILIPIVGLTARFALKPTVEALSRVFEGRTKDEAMQIMDRRIALLEQQVEAIESSMSRIEEASNFDSQLGSGDQQSAGDLPGNFAGDSASG